MKTVQPYPEGIAEAARGGMAAQAATRGEAAPPTLIGGTNGQKADFKGFSRILGIDWIQGTVPQDRLADLYDYLCEMCGCEPELFNRGILGFQRHAVWHPYGIALAWDVDKRNLEIHRYKGILQLAGQSCGCFPAESLYRFCWDLCTKFAFRCSRVDLCFDDYERIRTPEQVCTEACKGSDKKYSGYRKYRHMYSENSQGERIGDTLYFGTRGKDGSGKFLRCYDKNLESKGEINSIRWEVEFSKERANAIFFRIATALSLEEFVTKIAEFIGGSIDFLERRSGRRDRAERLAFWAKIIEILGSATIRNPRPVKTVEKAREWVERSVTPSLAMLRQAYGDEYYYGWLENQIKEAKISKLQRRVVDEFHHRKGMPENYELAPF